MQRPSVLLRRNPKLDKKKFGHVLIVAGSPGMLGASALCSLSAMRAGAGLVTAAVPKSLNLTLQRKISHVVMTRPLPETSSGYFSVKAYKVLEKDYLKYASIAIGPGIGLGSSTCKFVYQIVEHYPGPMVIDADALNALSKNLKPLKKANGARIITPHVGEMSRLAKLTPQVVKSNRTKIALKFAKENHCVVVLKGHRSVITDDQGRLMINNTGNVGMATAGSGDVLTGIIAGLLAQGIEVWKSATLGVYFHGKSGDLAARKRSKVSLIASDMIEHIFE